MVIYEVNLSINSEIYDDYYAWLLKHINDVLKMEGFTQAEIGFVKQQDDAHTNAKTLRVSYTVECYHHLENYLKYHATKLRAEGKEKFGNQFSATRRVIAETCLINRE